jgi:PIN domain nuclease of toxin-antitoxin system
MDTRRSLKRVWTASQTGRSQHSGFEQESVAPYLAKTLAENIELLPMTLDHILKIQALPIDHRDRFDRLKEGWPIITPDAVYSRSE